MVLNMGHLRGNQVMRVTLSWMGFVSFSSFHHVRTQWGHSKDTVQARGQLFSDPDHAGTLMLDFRPPELLRNKFPLFISHAVYASLLQQPKLTKAILIFSNTFISKFFPPKSTVAQHYSWRKNRHTGSSRIPFFTSLIYFWEFLKTQSYCYHYVLVGDTFQNSTKMYWLVCLPLVLVAPIFNLGSFPVFLR